MANQRRPSAARRVVEVNRNIVEPAAPKRKSLTAKLARDYPHAAKPHLALAKQLSSPLIMGPPLCDELMALVEHTFTEQEASVAQHLSPSRGRRARHVAAASREDVEQVRTLLESLACGKRVIAAEGSLAERRYRLMPIMPGMFEMVLISEHPESMSDWHRRFAELFETLFETGYTLDYQDRTRSMVRFLPVGRLAAVHPMALPADRLEVVLERFDVFGVGQCQCRISSGSVGHGCDRPLEVCTVMGRWAEAGIQAGWLRAVSRQDVLEIKREAESHGMATWIMNVESTTGQASCSCCGCCCKALRMVNEFSAPGVMAPPHFMPTFDAEKCTYCGRCAKQCPLGAIRLDTAAHSLDHQPARCVGCGLCAVACDTRQAIRMDPVPQYRLPYKSWYSLLLHNAPGMLSTALNVWLRR
jgi:Pyruvate/2-oxoacid:ferredoxin oxidoreductase delta subunit